MFASFKNMDKDSIFKHLKAKNSTKHYHVKSRENIHNVEKQGDLSLKFQETSYPKHAPQETYHKSQKAERKNASSVTQKHFALTPSSNFLQKSML